MLILRVLRLRPTTFLVTIRTLVLVVVGVSIKGPSVSGLAATEDRAVQPKVSSLGRDPRLKRFGAPLRTEEEHWVGSVVEHLARATRVPLICEGGLTARPVTVLLGGDVRAVELMEAVAETSHARWIRYGTGYILCRMPELVDLTSRPEEVLERERSALAHRMLPSLTAEQKTVLEAGGRVHFESCTPEQKEMARRMWGLALIEAPNEYRPEGLTGQGLFFRLQTDPAGSGRSFELQGPGYWADPISPIGLTYPP